MLTNPFTRAVEHHLGFPILPGHFPIVGHLPALRSHMHDVIREGERRLGTLFWLAVGPQRQLLCTAPESLEIFKNTTTSSAHTKYVAPLLLGESVVALDGPAHRRARGCMSSTFTPRGLTGAGIGQMTAELLDARARTWAARRRITVLPEIKDLMLELICRTLGVRIDERSMWRKHYEDLMLDTIPIRTRLPGLPGWRAARARVWLDHRVGALIGEARRATGAEGLTAKLARARNDEGGTLSEQHLVDNILYLLVAGYDTTASVMAWLVVELAAQPALWDELLAEATAAPGTPTSPEEIDRLPFADALFREAARLYPPVPIISRLVTGNLVLGGRQIPAGILVSASVGHLSRDGRRYPDPDRFDPARWLRRSDPLTSAEMVQFGAGPHFCLGYHLAWMQIVQFSVTLARVMAAEGLRPRLDAGGGAASARANGALPNPVYVPICHPPAKTQIVFDRA